MAKSDAAGRGLISLVLGGARSGKSRYAESLIKALPRPWFYVATGEAKDAEMAARIAEHKARRGVGWQTIEAPHDLAGALGKVPAGAPVLIDCLTLWLSNRMLAETGMDQEIDALDAALSRRGSCPTTRWRGASATCKGCSTRGSPPAPIAWSSWLPGCRCS
jgi:adenosyl cobinamide kinase/adenosyl cobinamide phosphate guanylyltransferase